MRKAWLASLGVAVTVGAALFIGAAAATTGAPVFYDARHPQPPSSDPGGYVAEPAPVDEGSAGGDDAGARGAAPDDEQSPTPPPTALTPPSAGAPATPPPTSAPHPTPTPSPEQVPVADRPAPGGPQPDGRRPSRADQRAWLEFQQVVRECMTAAGQEYGYWEWWNPGDESSNRFPPMPADLTAAEAAAWEAALRGSPSGDPFRWEDAGCWGYAVHVTGGLAPGVG